MNPKFCTHCGSPLQENAFFCAQCGNRVRPIANTAASPKSAVAPTPIPKKPKKDSARPFVVRLVTRSLILLLAILTLALSFAPMISVSADDLIDDMGDTINLDDYNFKLNVIDMSVLVFDSLYSLSASEMEESEIYEDLMDASDDLRGATADSYEDLSKRQKDAFERIVFYTLRLSLRSEDLIADPAFYFGVAASLLYVVYAVSFFVVALLAFLGAFDIGKLGSEKLGHALLVLLSTLPIVALLAFAALNLGFGQVVHMTAAFLVPILFSLAIILWVIIGRMVFDKVRYSAGTCVKRSFALALSLLIFLLSFAPIVNCHIVGEFAGTNGKDKTMMVKMTASSFSEFLYTDDRTDELENVNELNKTETRHHLESLLEDAYALSYRDGDTAAAHLLSSEIISHLFAASGVYKMAFLFTLIPLMLLGMMAFALLIIRSLLAFFMYGASDAKQTLCSKIFMLSFAALSLILVTVFLLSTSLTYNHYLDDQFRTFITPAFVILMIAVLGAVCVPCGTKSFVKATAEEAPSAEEESTAVTDNA